MTGYPVASLCVALLLTATPALADASDKAGSFGQTSAAVGLDDLADERGTANPFDMAEVFGGSTVSDNLVQYNGDVFLTQTSTIANSFNQSQGVITVVQNAGNNVLIQNATMVTINVY